MKTEEIELLLIDYLDGKLTDEQTISNLQKAMVENNMGMLEDYQQMDNILLKSETPSPSENMDAQFYTLLQKENRKEVNRFDFWFKNLQAFITDLFMSKVVSGAFLLMLGIGIGIFWNKGTNGSDEKIDELVTKVQSMQEEMLLTLIEQESATDRLKAVSLTQNISKADEKVVNALLQTLNNDANVNVRLVAIEALLRYAEQPEVRMGLINSISQQDSPLLQIALSEAMVLLSEKNAVQELRELLEKKDLNEAVKAKLTESIEVLL